ncbi:MAG: helix-turn-helix domain-containing protein [Nocardioides sp.]|jgi:excisionase family DNA binding protein
MNFNRPLIRVDSRSAPRGGDHPLSLAELLNVSSKTARRLVRDGKVDSIKVGARRLVLPESVEAYLARGGDA